MAKGGCGAITLELIFSSPHLYLCLVLKNPFCTIPKAYTFYFSPIANYVNNPLLSVFRNYFI